MRSFVLFCVFFFWDAAFLFAQEAAQPLPVPSTGQRLTAMIPMFLLVYLIFYLLVLRPQSKQLQEHQQLLNSLKKGEQVTTSHGIIGRVAGIEKDYILLEVAKAVKIKVERANIKKRWSEDKSEKSSE